MAFTGIGGVWIAHAIALNFTCPAFTQTAFKEYFRMAILIDELTA